MEVEGQREAGSPAHRIAAERSPPAVRPCPQPLPVPPAGIREEGEGARAADTTNLADLPRLRDKGRHAAAPELETRDTFVPISRSGSGFPVLANFFCG